MSDKIFANFVFKKQEKIESSFVIKEQKGLVAVLSVASPLKEHNMLKGRSVSDCHPINAITGLTEELSSKQDLIPDLQQIRSGSKKGESAVQPSTLDDYASKQALIDGLATKQDIIPDLEIIRMGANKGETAVQPNALKSYVPTSRKINNKELTTDIVLSAGDVSALPDSTNYGATLSASIDNVNYILTLTLKDQKGNVLGTPATVDLPLESVVVSGSYNNETKEVVLSLQNGSEIKFSVADLVSGLQPTIPDLSEIRDGASKGATAVQPATLNDYATKEYVDQQVGNIETALNNINSGG